MSTKIAPSIQDRYPDDFSHCFGCGRHNQYGHRLKSFPEGDEVVARFMPEPYHVAVPGFVYGGLLASLVDCHAMATASAAELAATGNPSQGTAPRYVTAALKIDYLKPTILGVELEIRGRVMERSAKKTLVALTVSADGVTTARGEVVAVPMPNSMLGYVDT